MSEICMTSRRAATRGIRFLPVVVGGIVGKQYFAYSGDLRRRRGSAAAILAGDQKIDFAACDLFCRGERVERRRLERAAVMLGDDEGRHQITRASVLSLSTSSATEPTFCPAWRFGGSSIFKTTSRGVTSMPRASGVVIAIRFLRAFMMF